MAEPIQTTKNSEKANGDRRGYIYLQSVNPHCGRIGTAAGLRDINEEALCIVRHSDPTIVAQILGGHFAVTCPWHNSPSADLVFTFKLDAAAKALVDASHSIRPTAKRSTMQLEDHICHCKLGQGQHALASPCNCSPYCTARETLRLKLLGRIRAEFPNCKNDKVFGGNTKIIKFVPQTSPDGLVYYLLYYISGSSAGDSYGWPNLCIEPLFPCYIPVTDGLPVDTGLNQFQRVCEVIPGLGLNVAFELTPAIINMAHSAKIHVRSVYPVPEQWTSPTLGDMITGQTLLRDLVEVLFLTSHTINGLYAAFQGDAPGAEHANIIDYRNYKFRVALCGKDNPEKIYYHIHNN
jgi:hypothetical protein